MSLKAKIEAVIYAAEEPVTLSQLVGLLGHEAQAELDRAESAQQSLLLDEPELPLELAASVGDAEATPVDAEATPVLAETEAASVAAEIAPVEPSSADAAGAAQDDAAGDAAVDEPSVAEQNETGPSVEQQAAAQPGDDSASVATESSAETAGDAAEDSDAADPLAAEKAEKDTAAANARAERTRATKLRAHFRVLLDELIAEYATSERGLEIREIAGGFKFATKPEYHDAVRGFVKSLKPPLKLTLQALETLAVVAYKQPVTAPEISEIRGVDSGGVLGSLMARKLITTAGRKQVIGRPILYKTTREFLMKFGLKDVGELPSIEEFEKMAGQLDEQEEIALPEQESPKPDESGTGESGAAESNSEPVPVPDPAYAPLVDSAPAESSSTESAPAEVEPDESEIGPDNKVAEITGDEASIDGRLSSLPPNYDAAPDDPSAAEAEIQSSIDPVGYKADSDD